MTTQPINHIELGLSRTATEYRNSPNFLAFIQALLKNGEELETALATVGLQSDIDIAEGVNLDVIGDIVGVSRVIPDAVLLYFFGFDDTTSGLNFGEEDGSGVNSGRFREEEESILATSSLADPEYRLLIRAKIVKNHSRGTGEDILAALSYIFPGVSVVLEDNNDMSFSLGIGRSVTQLEKALITVLDILPRPAGVRIATKVFFFPEDYFGFDGQLNAQPFGEEGDAVTGGIFAEEF